MKTIAYLRVSTGKQALSLEAQRTRTEAFATAMGIVLEGIFVDEAVSGGLPFASRPEGAKAMEALRGGGRILAVHLDRCFRSLADTDSTLAEWRKLEVTLTVLDMGGSPLDFSSASGSLLVRFLASVAEFEKESSASGRAKHSRKRKRRARCTVASPMDSPERQISSFLTPQSRKSLSKSASFAPQDWASMVLRLRSTLTTSPRSVRVLSGTRPP